MHPQTHTHTHTHAHTDDVELRDLLLLTSRHVIEPCDLLQLLYKKCVLAVCACLLICVCVCVCLCAWLFACTQFVCVIRFVSMSVCVCAAMLVCVCVCVCVCVFCPRVLRSLLARVPLCFGLEHITPTLFFEHFCVNV